MNAVDAMLDASQALPQGHVAADAPGACLPSARGENQPSFVKGC